MTVSAPRRALLKGFAGAGLLGLAPAAWPAMSGDRSLGVALVGLGYYASDLLAPGLQLTRHCHLAGIVTGSPHKAVEWQRRYGIPERNVYGYADFDRIADNPAIDVVYVVLPNHLHKPFTVRAANAGKHVWCEKPMAMNAAEGQAMIDACRRNKVHLSIGYRMQHEPNTRQIMALAREQPYGRVRTLRAEAGFHGFDDAGGSDNWRLDPARGGGAMYDMGVYALNAARYASGREPVAVTARSSVQRADIFRTVDESMDFELEFPDDISATCATSFGRNMNLLRVEADRGWYELSPFQAYTGIRGRCSDGRLLQASVPHQQALQMDNDALAIRQRRTPLVPGEEGLRDLRVLDAIFRSAKSAVRVSL